MDSLDELKNESFYCFTSSAVLVQALANAPDAVKTAIPARISLRGDFVKATISCLEVEGQEMDEVVLRTLVGQLTRRDAKEWKDTAVRRLCMLLAAVRKSVGDVVFEKLMTNGETFSSSTEVHSPKPAVSTEQEAVDEEDQVKLKVSFKQAQVRRIVNCGGALPLSL